MVLLPALLAASAYTVIEDRFPLRAACEATAEVVGQARQGDPVEIRFALSGDLGTCYKVSVTSGEKTIQGYLPARAVKGIEEFEKARQDAPGFNAPQSVQRQATTAATKGGDDAVARASRLIAANQPGQALSALEQALKTNRGDANLLSMAGLAAYQSDHVREAIGYWEESQALAHNPRVERMLAKAKLEAEKDRSSRSLIGIQFNFRYDDREIDAEAARGLIPVLDGEFTRISGELGCRSEERMTAVIQSRQAYLETTGAAEWSGGQYDGRIRVALLEAQPGVETRRALAHEIVHACLARNGQWPAWLHEGLAQKLSGQSVPAADRALVAELARGKRLPSLANMGQTFSRMSARHARAAYATALIAVELLYEHYGPAGVHSLMNNPAMLAQVTVDLDRRLRE